MTALLNSIIESNSVASNSCRRRTQEQFFSVSERLPWVRDQSAPFRIFIRGLLLALVVVLSTIPAVLGQELNVSVEVDRSRLSGSSLSFLNNFPEEIEDYLNAYDWIDPRFDDHERIDVTIQITLLSIDQDYNVDASLVINSRRPIYNTLRQTSLLLYSDENWSFNYAPNRRLIHDNLQFDALTTLLDFYAYIILGYDFDSFSELGGTPYFNRAQNMVSLAQMSSSPGWSRTGSNPRSRAQLITDLLSPNYRELRRAMYVYHRHGLDQFVDDPDKARRQIITALKMIQEARTNTTGNLLFNTFFDAKYREIVSVFEDAPVNIRQEVYNILSQVDQSHLSAYERLR